jgi:glycerol-3-phosphate acyltransferase PlsX
MVRIVVDAMGGDLAPGVNIEGALMAIEETPELHVTLVGDTGALTEQLRKHSASKAAEKGGRLSLVHSEEVISMDDHGATAIRKKKHSSISVGLELVKRRDADAFVSAGNSGAVMAGALLILGRLSDVERPAIVVKLPTAEGFVIILDVGANVDCKASNLVQFAEMGNIYAQVIEGIASPRIGLISNGSEPHKGNELTRETHELLKDKRGLNYLGYVEGFDLFRGTADVAVCDGFVGNVVLKTAEGLADTAFQWFRKELRRDVLGLMGVVMMKKVLKNFKKKFDYQPYGAAPLLGIDGMVLISHGSSTGMAIRNGILTAKRGVDQSFVHKISSHIEKHRKQAVRNPQG